MCFGQNSEGKAESKGKKASNKPLKILDEDDEDLSALKDPSEKVSGALMNSKPSGGNIPARNDLISCHLMKSFIKVDSIRTEKFRGLFVQAQLRFSSQEKVIV